MGVGEGRVKASGLGFFGFGNIEVICNPRDIDTSKSVPPQARRAAPDSSSVCGRVGKVAKCSSCANSLLGVLQTSRLVKEPHKPLQYPARLHGGLQRVQGSDAAQVSKADRVHNVKHIREALTQ